MWNFFSQSSFSTFHRHKINKLRPHNVLFIVFSVCMRKCWNLFKSWKWNVTNVFERVNGRQFNMKTLLVLLLMTFIADCEDHCRKNHLMLYIWHVFHLKIATTLKYFINICYTTLHLYMNYFRVDASYRYCVESDAELLTRENVRFHLKIFTWMNKLCNRAKFKIEALMYEKCKWQSFN